MLVAAEASGDDRGAALIRALRRRLGSDVRFIGVGGANMAREGVESPFDIAELSILGLVEGLLAYRRVVARVKDTILLAEAQKPDVVVLIDSWGFTLRVAQALRRLQPSLPLVKYVGPQVWASRPGRARTLAATVDLLLSIHAFDAPYFQKEGLKTVFVGNGALALDFTPADPAGLRQRLGIGPGEPVLLVLPGSRPGEIKRVLPAFEGAVRRLKAARPDLQIIVPAASTVAQAVHARVAGWPFRAHVIENEADKLSAMKAADVALACSGTVTTELALAGCPLVVGYRLSPLTYALLKPIIRTPYITLLNIAAQAFVAPELVQGECNPERLAAEVERLLASGTERQAQRDAQFAALDQMGRGGADPAEAAAGAIMDFLSGR